jgi:RimJ/RimL family protein N-acetyltransferase
VTDTASWSFRPLTASDLPMLYEWRCRPHVAQWWPPPLSFAAAVEDLREHLDPNHSTRGHVALSRGQPAGFIQSYHVMEAGDGWWEDETDPGARGIDQFLANGDQLGRGLGSAMVAAFVDQLFADPVVTKVQTDPSPDNERAIRAYRKAGFRPEREVTTPDGPALLMVCPRARDAGDAGAFVLS